MEFLQNSVYLNFNKMLICAENMLIERLLSVNRHFSKQMRSTKMGRIKNLLQLYWSFFKIGGLTFGGGLSMLPMLERELVQKRNWVTEDEILDCYAIGQCTPGIIAVNTATFVGYKKEKIAGGIFATLGMISPSIIVISLVAAFFEIFLSNKWFAHALMGVRSVVCAMLIDTIINLSKKCLKTLFAWIICVVVLILGFFTKIPTVVLVLMAAAAGVIFYEIKLRRNEKINSLKNENSQTTSGEAKNE